MKQYWTVRYWRKNGYRFMRYIPRVMVYGICLYFFVGNVSTLLFDFLNYSTMVLVKYDNPDDNDYPAITVCGCCTQTPTRENGRNTEKKELDVLSQTAVYNLLDNASFHLESMVTSCTVVNVNNNQVIKLRKECSEVTQVLTSFYEGRKCFTFFSKLSGSQTNLGDQYLTSTTSIMFDIRFQTLYYSYSNDVDPAAINSDIVLAVHRANAIPTILDTEFVRIDPYMVYDIHFTTQKIKLLPLPYKTACQKYDKTLSKLIEFVLW